MGALLAQSGSPAEKPVENKKQFLGHENGETMEMLIDGTGGPADAGPEGRKHFEAPADAMTGGEVGMTTSGEPTKFTPSIKVGMSKPTGHGNLIAQDTEPSDLACTHHSKRVFPDKSGGTESAAAEDAPVPKRTRTDMDDTRVKAALHPETMAAPAEPVAGMKKQVDGVANKCDRVLQADDDAGCAPVGMKHFPGRGNDADKVHLEHPMSAKKAPKAPKPAPELPPVSDAPVAGMKSAAVNRVKMLSNATNAPEHGSAGMTSAEINAPVKPVYAQATPAPKDAAGKTSEGVNKEASVASTVTAAAAKAAMSGSAVSSCLSWGN